MTIGSMNRGRLTEPAVTHDQLNHADMKGLPMMANDNRCINLRRSFGQRYKIGFDEAAVTWGERADAWMQTILCQRGTIYPFGGSLLAVEIDNRPVTAKLVAGIPGVTLWQDGDSERTLVFPVVLFDQVAAIVKPRKRRRLSEEQKAKCVERLAKYGPKSPRQSDGETLEPLATAQDG